ncbi:MAG: HEAT repeat domain-containing protein [Planctomycetes bacterium]|nr:HEAT repeat domain-containing protein [Planctomycetota bacterium]
MRPRRRLAIVLGVAGLALAAGLAAAGAWARREPPPAAVVRAGPPSGQARRATAGVVPAPALPSQARSEGPSLGPLRLTPPEGARYHYALEIVHSTRLDGQAEVLSSVRGELVVRVRQRLPDGAVTLDHDTSGLAAEVAAGDRRTELPLAGVVRVRRDGRGALLGLAPDASLPAESRNLQRALVAVLGLVLPEGGEATWEAEERDLTGLALARYERRPSAEAPPGGLALSRTRRVLSVDGVEGDPPVTTRGSLQAVLDPEGMPLSLEGEETTDIDGVGLGVPFRVQDERRIRLERRPALGPARSVPAAAPANSLAWEAVPRAEASPLAVGAEGRPRGPHDSEPVDSLLLALERAWGTEDWEAVAPRRFLALVRRLAADESEAGRAGERLASGRLLPPSPSVLVEALGEAGTPAAQRALLAGVDGAGDPELHALACLSLGSCRRLLPEARAFLEAAVLDPALRAHAVQGMGMAADRAEESEAAEALVVRLEGLLAPDGPGGDPSPVLIALGNAARPRSLPVLDPFLLGADPELRRAAAGALSRMEGQPAADRLMTLAWRDADPRVRREAVRALDGRRDEDGVAGLLADLAALDPDPGVREAAAGRPALIRE